MGFQECHARGDQVIGEFTGNEKRVLHFWRVENGCSLIVNRWAHDGPRFLGAWPAVLDAFKDCGKREG